jgi:hypothetical protein
MGCKVGCEENKKAHKPHSCKLFTGANVDMGFARKPLEIKVFNSLSMHSVYKNEWF